MKQQPFNLWIDCVKNDRSGMLATVLSDLEEVQMGSRLFVSEYGDKCGSLGDHRLDEQVAKIAMGKLRQVAPGSETHEFDLHKKSVTVFMDIHVPSPEVMIFGAGHDAIPVAAFARQSGFRVTVVDQRAAFANEERFPETDIIIARPEHLADMVHPDQRTFIVIMNHHLDKDRVCLHFALDSEAPYVGLLGPRKRRNRLLKALQDQGVMFPETAMSRLYNPIGLDIGAEGSEEIAISIISEIIAIKHGKIGGFLRTQYDPDKAFEMTEKR